MALTLVVYDPPAPGFPYLAAVLETEPTSRVAHVQTCTDSSDAHAVLLRLAEILERDGIGGLRPGLDIR